MKGGIRYIKRSNLDVSKYDACIRNAKNSKIYAYSWYLDIVAKHWDVLVLDDYKAVMPIPWRKKFCIKYIYTPVWTQQLGVFSGELILEPLVSRFIDAIPRKFKKTTIFLNDGNKVSNKNITIRDNFVLPLDKDYDEIYQHFSKNRRQSLRKTKTPNVIISQNHSSIFPFYIDYIIEKTGTEIRDLAILDNLLQVCYKKDKAFVVEARNRDDEIIGGAVFLIDNKRLYYLFSALSDEGKKKQAMSHIVVYIIKKYAGTDYILDFEGSTVLGIASFFKSFGSINKSYYLFQKFSLFL